MLKLYTFCSALLLLALSFTSALAQSDIAKSDIVAVGIITASSSGESVRFTAPSSVAQIRLEIRFERTAPSHRRQEAQTPA